MSAQDDIKMATFDMRNALLLALDGGLALRRRVVLIVRPMS